MFALRITELGATVWITVPPVASLLSVIAGSCRVDFVFTLVFAVHLSDSSSNHGSPFLAQALRFGLLSTVNLVVVFSTIR